MKNLLSLVRKNSTPAKISPCESETGERRKEQRLYCKEQILFVYGFMLTSSGGQLVDVSSCWAAFTCSLNAAPPGIGETMLVRLKIPHPNSGATDFARRAYTRRVDNIDNSSYRIVIQFAKPLPYKPVENRITQFKKQRKIKAATL
ncbi:MAG: hypothetical protein ACYSSI_00560 [Planctomycetota bacterium]